VTPSANFDTLARWLGRSTRRRSLADRIGQGLQVIGLGGFIRRLADWEADDVPAAGSSHPVGMPCAQVVAMWLDEGGERA
jgi:hypothetical protein